MMGNTMKKFNFMILMLVMLAMPFANADTTLFEKEMSDGEADVFYNEEDITVDISIDDVDLGLGRCKVNIDGSASWVYESHEVEIDGFKVTMETSDYDRCKIKIKPIETEDFECTDTDGGKDYYEQGKVNGWEIPGVKDLWTDYCGVSGNEEGKLVEYVCRDDEYGQKVIYDCPNGCYWGACIGDDSTKEIESGTEEVEAKFFKIEEGETKYHNFGGKKYEVKLLVVEDVSPVLATFSINGEVSRQVKKGDSIEMGSDAKMIIKSIYLVSDQSEHLTGEFIESDDFVNYYIAYADGSYDWDDEDNCKIEYEKCMTLDHDEDCKEEYMECRYGYEETEEILPVCEDGCFVNHDMNKCLPFGTRLEYEGVASYCDVDGDVKSQKEDNLEANNNYECRSNSARYGVCENIEEQQNVIMKMFGWLSRIFGGN